MKMKGEDEAANGACLKLHPCTGSATPAPRFGKKKVKRKIKQKINKYKIRTSKLRVKSDLTEDSTGHALVLLWERAINPDIVPGQRSLPPEQASEIPTRGTVGERHEQEEHQQPIQEARPSRCKLRSRELTAKAPNFMHAIPEVCSGQQIRDLTPIHLKK